MNSNKEENKNKNADYTSKWNKFDLSQRRMRKNKKWKRKMKFRREKIKVNEAEELH